MATGSPAGSVSSRATVSGPAGVIRARRAPVPVPVRCTVTSRQENGSTVRSASRTTACSTASSSAGWRAYASASADGSTGGAATSA